jgi:hypothetical protein
VLDRIDEHPSPSTTYIPRAKLAEALPAAARLRGERFHRDFVPGKAIWCGCDPIIPMAGSIPAAVKLRPVRFCSATIAEN